MNPIDPNEPSRSEQDEEASSHDAMPDFGLIHEGATNCLWAFVIMCGVTLMGVIVTFRSVDSLDFYRAFLYGFVGSFYLQIKGLSQLRSGVSDPVPKTLFAMAIGLFCGFWPVMAMFFVPIMHGANHIVGEPISLATICFLLLNLLYNTTLFLCFLRVSKLVGNTTVAHFSLAALISLIVSLAAGVLFNMLIFEEKQHNFGLPTVAQRDRLILYIMTFVSLFVIAHACYGVALRLIQHGTRKHKHLPKQPMNKPH